MKRIVRSSTFEGDKTNKSHEELNFSFKFFKVYKNVVKSWLFYFILFYFMYFIHEMFDHHGHKMDDMGVSKYMMV